MTRLAIASLGVLLMTPGSGWAQGEELYQKNKCSLCHSVGGKGNAKGPLEGVGSKYYTLSLHDALPI